MVDRIVARPEAEWTDGQITGHLELLESYWKDYISNHLWLLHGPDLPVDEPTQETSYAEMKTSYLSAKGCLYDARACRPNRASSETGSDAFEYGVRRPSHLPRIEISR